MIYTQQTIHLGAHVANARPGPDGSFWYRLDGELFWTSATAVERLGLVWRDLYHRQLRRAELPEKAVAADNLFRLWHRICRDTEQTMLRARTESPSGRSRRIIAACWDAVALRLAGIQIGATAQLPTEVTS